MTQRTDFGGYGAVARDFSRVDARYHSPWVIEWLRESIGKPPELTRIIELGCGTGSFMQHLSRLGLIFGVDPDERMLACAQETANLKFVHGHTDRLKFPDGFFDAVVAHNAFEHFCDDPASIAEIRRVLNPSGVFMSVTWPISGLSKKRSDVIRPFATMPRSQPPLGHLSDTGYAGLLRAEGFRDVQTRTRQTVVRYTVGEAKQYMRAAGALSAVPEDRLPEVYAALDAFCEREADPKGNLYRDINVIADMARAPA